MNKTDIEWVRNPDGTKGCTWNPVVGCKHGCPYCYARRFAERGLGEYGEHLPGKRFEPRILPERLSEPAKVRKPQRIFAVSMGDLFGNWVPAEWIEAVMQTVRECPQHTFMFLTKNPKRYRGIEFPPNAWVGVTCEDQAAANGRIPHLLTAPAAVRFVSLEPLLGPVDLNTVPRSDDAYFRWRGETGCITDPQEPDDYVYWTKRTAISWVIIGAQTGPGAQLPDPWWIGSIIDQCRGAGVPVFVKDNAGIPERIQQWPEVRA